MGILGLRDTDNFVADQRPKNWREAVMRLYPNGNAPLFALTSVMKKGQTDDPEYSWWEKKFPNQRLVLSGNITDVATTLAITAGTDLTTGGALQVKAGTVLYAEHTGELMLVTADPTVDTSIVVSRAFAGSTNLAITVATQNPHLLVVGTAHMEGVDTPTAISYNPTKRFSYTQIFRNSLDMTRTASKTRLRTGDQVREAKRECLELHSVEIEKALWFGRRSEDLTGAQPRRTTDGIITVIARDAAANVIPRSGAAYSMTLLETDMEAIFRFGSQEKMAYCGNLALLNIQRIIRLATGTRYNIKAGDKEYGMNVSRIVTPFGVLVLKSHPLFNLLTQVTGAYLGLISSMIVLDMAQLKYRPFVDADTKYLPDRQGNGIDGMKSEYLTECGLEIGHPQTHFHITGINTAAAG